MYTWLELSWWLTIVCSLFEWSSLALFDQPTWGFKLDFLSVTKKCQNANKDYHCCTSQHKETWEMGAGLLVAFAHLNFPHQSSSFAQIICPMLWKKWQRNIMFDEICVIKIWPILPWAIAQENWNTTIKQLCAGYSRGMLKINCRSLFSIDWHPPQKLKKQKQGAESLWFNQKLAPWSRTDPLCRCLQHQHRELDFDAA